MKIEIVENDEKKWRDLYKHDFTPVFRTFEWAKVALDNPKYIIARDGEELIGWMAFQEKRLTFIKIRTSCSMPIGTNDEVKLNILRFFKSLSGVNIVNTTYQDHRLSNLAFKTGFNPTEKATVIVDLTKHESTMEFLDKDSRYDVNKAKKQGVTVVDATIDENAWEEFFEIYDDVGKTWGVGTLNKEDFMRFKSLIPHNLVKLFVAKSGDKIASGAIILNSEDTVIFYINASNQDIKHIQANSILIYEIMDYAKRNGFQYFDLFGYDLFAKKNEKTYGINKFKMSFGGEVKKFYKFTNSTLFVIARKLYNKIRILKNFYFFIQRTRG
ncbi:MAG: GNAT family N-acetyltransferase [Candidatus Aenigmarchaeota archaeon]|nr:GNAT family N-acetyltransferase [Candidatus Aenigmarchaeota archaeon]